MKGMPMKISHVWKSGSAKKKTKPTYKIRWELLGLSRPDPRDPPSADEATSEASLEAGVEVLKSNNRFLVTKEGYHRTSRKDNASQTRPRKSFATAASGQRSETSAPQSRESRA
jgi:hypothetical protein